jgi:cytidyltransferase-like protein
MNDNKIVVVFGGRFQPMHLGHLYAYDHLCKKYGKANVWVVSSNKTSPDSPLTFVQKKKIATEFLGIPKDRFVYCKIPYVPQELINTFPDKDFSLILALGSKDGNRLVDNDHFQPLPKDLSNLHKVDTCTYIDTTPMFADSRNATAFRKQMQGDMPEKVKKSLFVKTFGQFDQEIFNALTSSNQ